MSVRFGFYIRVQQTATLFYTPHTYFYFQKIISCFTTAWLILLLVNPVNQCNHKIFVLIRVNANVIISLISIYQLKYVNG